MARNYGNWPVSIVWRIYFWVWMVLNDVNFKYKTKITLWLNRKEFQLFPDQDRQFSELFSGLK